MCCRDKPTINYCHSGRCPDDQFECGSECLPNYYSSSYQSCGEDCIYYSQQCQGQCPADQSPCGDTQCLSPSSWRSHWECGDSCIRKTSHCDYSCPPQHFLCCNHCRPDSSTSWWMCGQVGLSVRGGNIISMLSSRTACLRPRPVAASARRVFSRVAMAAGRTPSTTGDTTDHVARNALLRASSAMAAVLPIEVCLVGTPPATPKIPTMAEPTELVEPTASQSPNSATAPAPLTEASCAERPPATRTTHHRATEPVETAVCTLPLPVTAPALRTSCSVESSA